VSVVRVTSLDVFLSWQYSTSLRNERDVSGGSFLFTNVTKREALPLLQM
jgi:hypothetical protein